MYSIKDYSLPLLSAEERTESVCYFAEHKMADTGEILFWALMKGKIEFADALIKAGITLQNARASYRSGSYYYENASYIAIITESFKGAEAVYSANYFDSMISMSEEKFLPVLSRLSALAEQSGKKLLITKNLFTERKWDDALNKKFCLHLDKYGSIEKHDMINLLALFRRTLVSCL